MGSSNSEWSEWVEYNPESDTVTPVHDQAAADAAWIRSLPSYDQPYPNLPAERYLSTRQLARLTVLRASIARAALTNVGRRRAARNIEWGYARYQHPEVQP